MFSFATTHKLMPVVKHSCSTSFLFRLQHPFSGVSSTEEWCGEYVVSGRKEHANNDSSKTTVRYALTDSSGTPGLAGDGTNVSVEPMTWPAVQSANCSWSPQNCGSAIVWCMEG